VGAVYRARDAVAGKQVALKLVHLGGRSGASFRPAVSSTRPPAPARCRGAGLGSALHEALRRYEPLHELLELFEHCRTLFHVPPVAGT
jgi:hypothetical protein